LLDRRYEHEESLAGGGNCVVKLPNVGMIERSDGFGFSFEWFTELTLGNLDRDHAIEPRVTSLVDLAHAARANGREVS